MESPAASRSSASSPLFWGSDSGDEPFPHPPSGHLPASSPPPPHARPRPRLSSPRLFPRDFMTLPAPNVATRTQSFMRPADYRRTMDDVNRALDNANRAVQNAQDAFNGPQTVDLTESSPRSVPEGERAQRELQSPQAVRTQAPGRHGDLPRTARHLPPMDRHPPPMQHATAGQFHNLQPGRGIDNTRRGIPPALQEEMIRVFLPNGMPRLPFIHANANANLFSFEPRPPNPQEARIQDERAIQRQRDARALWDSNQRHRPPPRRTLSRSPPFEPLAPSSSPSSLFKRQRNSQNQRQSLSPSPHPPVESIDLTAVDDTASLSAALSRQRQDAITSQDLTSGSDGGRTPLTSYKCPICMETPTDATTTVCGHLFCHRCIIETLKWSEDQRQDDFPHGRAKGVCPVCRKQMDRKDLENQKSRTLVPLNLMLGQQVRKRRKDKGKEVARDVGGKENATKKRETSEEMWERLTMLD